jgi:hypothetical protein
MRRSVVLAGKYSDTTGGRGSGWTSLMWPVLIKKSMRKELTIVGSLVVVMLGHAASNSANTRDVSAGGTYVRTVVSQVAHIHAGLAAMALLLLALCFDGVVVLVQVYTL